MGRNGAKCHRRGCGGSATITELTLSDGPCVLRCCVLRGRCAHDVGDCVGDHRNRENGYRQLAPALLASCRAIPPVRARHNSGERRGRCGCALPRAAMRTLPERDDERRANETAGPRVSPARRGALARVGRKPDRASIGEESVTESRYNATSLHADVLTMRSQCTHGAIVGAGFRADSTDPALRLRW